MARMFIMTRAFHWFSLIAGILLFSHASVQADEDHELARKLRDAGAILPLEEIVRHARAAKQGELLETDLEKKHGRYVYEVEILDKTGQVWEIEIDAANGRLMSVERDD